MSSASPKVGRVAVNSPLLRFLFCLIVSFAVLVDAIDGLWLYRSPSETILCVGGVGQDARTFESRSELQGVASPKCSVKSVGNDNGFSDNDPVGIPPTQFVAILPAPPHFTFAISWQQRTTKIHIREVDHFANGPPSDRETRAPPVPASIFDTRLEWLA